MTSVRLFLCLFRWDVVREVRRKETIPNMLLFALLILFLARIGVSPDEKASREMGPVMFWISILFAGSVGLSQGFAAEREGSGLGGIVTAPFDIGLFYLAKVAASWVYVMVMEVLVFLIYAILFGFPAPERLASVAGVMGVFTLGYIAAGVVLAAMTTALRGGGEVLLRILLVPLMIPFIWVVLLASQTLFDTDIAGGYLGGHPRLSHVFLVGAALDLIYLTAGYLLFPKVLEE